MADSPLPSNTPPSQTKPRPKRSKTRKVKNNHNIITEATIEDFAYWFEMEGPPPEPPIPRAERDSKLSQLATANQQLVDIRASLDKLIDAQLMDSWYLLRARYTLQLAHNDLNRLRQDIEARPVAD